MATKASDTVLDAMLLMSDYGVSSVAVIEEEGGALLSAVSVTDVGKVRMSRLSSSGWASVHAHTFLLDRGAIPK